MKPKASVSRRTFLTRTAVASSAFRMSSTFASSTRTPPCVESGVPSALAASALRHLGGLAVVTALVTVDNLADAAAAGPARALVFAVATALRPRASPRHRSTFRGSCSGASYGVRVPRHVIHSRVHKLDEMLWNLWIIELSANCGHSVSGPLEAGLDPKYLPSCAGHGAQVGRNRSRWQ